MPEDMVAPVLGLADTTPFLGRGAGLFPTGVAQREEKRRRRQV
jgi:hypothetical protein